MISRKSLFIFVSILLATIIGLAACSVNIDLGQDDTSPLNIIYDGKSNYRIVCPYDIDSSVVNAALLLSNTTQTKTGALIDVVADVNAPREDSSKEILIGKTDRGVPESVFVESPMEFIIAASGTDIYILGGSDSATVMALEYFAENIIAEPTVIERDFVYRHTLPYTTVNVNSKTVTGFLLNDFEGVDTALVAQALSEKTGLPVSDALNGTNVYFELDYSLESNTVRFAERNNEIVISASSKIALEQIDEVILNNFPGYASLNLDHGSFVDFSYPIVSITKISNNQRCYFTCETDKSPLEYTVGEEMTFTLSLKYDGETVSAPMFSYKLEFDGNQETLYGEAPGESGTFEIKTSIDTPGFVKIYANATSSIGVEFRDILPFEGGAAANIDEITQSVSEPEDFDEFWQSEIARLDEVAPVMTVKKDISENYPGYTVLDIRIDCVDAPVSGYLSIPDGAKPGSLGILVGYTGYGVISPEPTVREDRIVFTVNAHSLDNGRESGYYSEVASTILYSYGFNRYENADRNRVYFKNMILRDVQAVRYLKTLKEWNGKDVVLNGGSQGGYQCLAVAAFDPDVTYVYAAYPWLCDLGNTTLNRIPGWHPEFTEALRYYDAINFAKRIKCQTRIDAGLGDYVSPPSGVAAMVNAMSAPVKLDFTQGMTHTHLPPEAQEFTIEK